MEMEIESLADPRPRKPDKRKRARQACDHCRAKKIRCNGETTSAPCPNCIDRGHICVTTSRGRQSDNNGSASTRRVVSRRLPHNSDAIDVALLSPQSSSAPTNEPQSVGTGNYASVDITGDVPESSSVLPSDMTNWEYHGARSYLSICSKPAIKWIGEQTRDSSFAKIANDFVIDVTGRLKMDADISSSRAPEPDTDTAWQYTTAYFENALDAALGVVHRPWFEQQLAAHLSGVPNEASPTWHALRNVVYAAGCRIVLSKSCTFQEASRRAWLYFENALAVYARLLFYKTSVTGVQVLTLMAYYTHNLGTPCLEYMLIADAVRLAFAKGLHQACPSSQGLKHEDIEQRNCLFWAIYCLEKQIACQGNRPSIIDDDEVTCPMPSAGSCCRTFSLPYCQSLVEISKVSSRIDKQLSAVRCSRVGAEATVQAIYQLQTELDHVKTSLHDTFGLVLGRDIDLNRLPNAFSFDQLVYTQFAYFTAVLSVHTVLAYPWMRPLFGLGSDDRFRDAIISSSDAVAQASREVITMTEHIKFAAHTTLPVSWFVPIYAMISLFVCLLDRRRKSPSDLAVMDIGTGYFAKLRLATGSLISTPFARSITSLAYRLEGQAEAGLADGSTEVGTGQTDVLDEAFWQSDLLDEPNMFHVEDWSLFSHTTPVSTPIVRSL